MTLAPGDLVDADVKQVVEALGVKCGERPFEAVLEAREREDSGELAPNVAARIIGESIQLRRKLLARVDEQDDVLEIPAGQAIAASAVGERLELDDHEPGGRNDPQPRRPREASAIRRPGLPP